MGENLVELRNFAQEETRENKYSGNRKIVIVPKSDLKQGEKVNGSATLKKCSVYIGDCFFTAVIVGPMVVAHWRGIWVLMDFHENIFSGWLCFGLGMSLHLLFAVLKYPLHEAFAGERNEPSSSGCGVACAKFARRVVRTIYTYVFSLACNCHWRGAWIVLNDWFGSQAGVIACFTCAVLGDLILLRCIRNLLAPPFLVTLDSPKFVFRFPTIYKSNTKDWPLYILDCAFSVGVIGTLVVFVWRGAWVLFDLFLFPDNREHSALGSVVLGYVIVVVTFTLQPLMRYTCARLTGLTRLLAADCFLLISFVGTVNVWRGIWMVLDLWLLPSKPELSCWITHLGCFVFLVLLNCSNSVLVRGVYVDAEEAGGKCVIFPCHYLRLFFKIEKEKKEARRRNLIEAAARELNEKDPTGENGAAALLLDPRTLKHPMIQPAKTPESFV